MSARSPIPTLLVTALAVAACSGADATPGSTSAAGSGSDVPNAAISAGAEAELPTVLVYKTPTCGCCNGWIEHLEAAGFTVDARNVRDLMTIKVDGGVPTGASSCHTAIVDGYIVEGHVPADQVKRLLAERPAVAGIAVPGMPIGSPGMEGRNPQPYEVLSFAHDGTTEVFAEVDPR